MQRKLLSWLFLTALILISAAPAVAYSEYVTIGAGTEDWDMPLFSVAEDARTQSIYLASEIGMSGIITSLALDITWVPSEVLENFTIRMKHTPLSFYPTASWDQGWTVVYQNNEPRGTTGWRTFTFISPFYYNGTDNLMVDFSFNKPDDSYQNGQCRYTYQNVVRTLYYCSWWDSGDPLTWSGISNPPPWLHKYRPNIKMEIQSLADTDGDGLYDWWEAMNSCMMADTVDNLADCEPDGLNNDQEYAAYTNPCVADTEGDGLSDGAEVLTYLTNPKSTDTDADDMPDGWEVAQGFSPLVNDAAQDADSDGLSNFGEYITGTDPYDSDSDNDTMPDGYEVLNGLNPLVDDTAGDLDSDGLTNLQEFSLGAKVKDADTDDDGLSDGQEVNTYLTNPLEPDTDGGGENDGSEVVNGSNPLIPRDDDILITLGTGNSSWALPLYASYNRVRTQCIYIASEIEMPGQIISLSLDITNLTYGVLKNFTIRLKHTPLSSYSIASWEQGWTVVYQNNEPLGSTGWRTFIFTTPFDYNGTDNLMVDFSFNIPSTFGIADCRYTQQAVNRTIYYSGFSSFGDPLLWSGTSNPIPSLHTYRPNIKIQIHNPTDTDGDGLRDFWENRYSCMTANTVDNLADYEPDGLDNDAEFSNDTDPCVSDTDDDGLTDGDEVFIYLSDPTSTDTDADGLTDGDEVNTHGANPILADTDGDGLGDGAEVNTYGTNPLLLDTDYDGMPDGWEENQGGSCGLDPLIFDPGLDGDADGLNNIDEYNQQTKPCDPDTDDDALKDGEEVSFYGSLPLDLDTDGDSCGDGYEARQGSNWLDPDIYPRVIKIGSDVRVNFTPMTWGTPRLAWSGSEYGVAWEDLRYGDAEIYFRRLSSTGALLGSEVRVTNAIHDSFRPEMVWSGSEYGISFQDFRYDENGSCYGFPFDDPDCVIDVYFCRLNSQGVKLGDDTFVYQPEYGNEPNSISRDELVWTGSEYGLSWINFELNFFWESVDSVMFVRISPEGEVIEWPEQISSSCSWCVDVYWGHHMVWSGSYFGVTWQTWDLDSRTKFLRVYPNGYHTSTVKIDDSSYLGSWNDLAWRGSEFGIIWSGKFSRISSGGNKIGGAMPLSAASPYLFWFKRMQEGEILYMVSPSESPDGLLLPGFDHQTVVYTGSEYGTCWTSNRDGTRQVYFHRFLLDRDGDGLPDDAELFYGTNSLDWDSDDDTISDGAEFISYDTDGDGMPDVWELTNNLNPFIPDGAQDPDNDGLTNLIEYQQGTSPLNWDTDGDALPDGYEVGQVSNLPPLDPLNALDGAVDFDGDGNSNANEYWNGTDPWASNPTGAPGCCYWGDAGLGDRIVSPTDAIELKKALSGGAGNYTGVIPNNGETHELDMDGYVSPLDLIILQKMIVQAAIPVLGSRPVALEILEPPPPTVAVGLTCHVTVGVKNESTNPSYNYTPGLGVVFEIVAAQSTGTATILGGEGAAPPASRYDISGPIASSGSSRIVLRIDSTGTITLRALIPECGSPGVGRSSSEIILDPAAVILAQ